MERLAAPAATASLILAGLLAGCGWVSLDPASSYVWGRRGKDTGELIRTYCEQGSAWERGVFMHYVDQMAGGAIVVIRCPLDRP